jgi:hypothetical protein
MRQWKQIILKKRRSRAAWLWIIRKWNLCNCRKLENKCIQQSKLREIWWVPALHREVYRSGWDI